MMLAARRGEIWEEYWRWAAARWPDQIHAIAKDTALRRADRPMDEALYARCLAAAGVTATG
jgi:hypothetical protein